MPLRFSCTRADTTPSCACTAVERASTVWLKRLAISTSAGNGTMA